MSSAQPLAGQGVVITRPLAQAASLAQKLEAAGGRALIFPLIDIQPLPDLAPLKALVEVLADFDLAFFVSSNAVAQTMAVIPQSAWPAHLRVATVGPGSARALQQAGFADVIVPTQAFDSEAVLDLGAFSSQQITGRRVLILRGEGGRELLADTLRARGAQVSQLSCYRRLAARPDTAPLLDSLAAAQLQAISFTSSESILNFADLLQARTATVLRALPVFVPHVRIAEQAARHGAQEVITTDAGDEGLLSALARFFSSMHTPGKP